MSDNEGDMSINELWVKMQKLINAEAEKTNKNVDSKTSEILTKMDDALSRISNLEERMGDALDRITVLENTQQTDKVESQEQLYYEVQERLSREKNIILFGVPESDEAEFVANFLVGFFSGVDPSFKIDNYRYIRFGKKAKDKSRPVKVIFSSSEHAKWCLQNKGLFADFEVKIVNDKTPEQLNYLKNSGKQLDELKINGRKNLIIKYIKGMPKIVEKSDNRIPSQGSYAGSGKLPEANGGSGRLRLTRNNYPANQKPPRSRSNSSTSSSSN
ncbi:hypothetical protein QAD02_002209 [Eretmocerus hayati]|uniref:Uncharacterized protein n=1 Tax=Eretmocerus hayati TaxID=131215 RepID=A0ACC2NN33_9HYME|nr:hypothetical protein QAD02_002209 [Eretmocerus hayati]